ncbi:MAG TPA: OmpH family outer membrane protein [Holophagaceae bacterium]
MRLIAPFMAAALCLPAVAQEPPTPRFAFFSVNQLVRISKKAAAVFSELEATGKGLQEKLQAKGAELQSLQQQMNSPSIDPARREELQKKYRDLEFDAKKLQEDSQQEYQRVEKKVSDRITLMAKPIVEQLAKEEHLQVIFSDQAVQVFSWADETWMKSFTAEVAKRLDASSDGSTPAPAAKPAGKKK